MLETKNLELALPVSSQISAHQAQPDSALRIRRESARSGHRRRREYSLYLKIPNLNELSRNSADLGPDIMIGILGDSHDEAKRAPVQPLDWRELTVFQDRHGVIETDPEPA